ncbi:HIT-like domain-containing protein [Syncephalis plumigaleata]|nr:HIT-like domain-containing protein [Syncephalis plumigaleata]
MNASKQLAKRPRVTTTTSSSTKTKRSSMLWRDALAPFCREPQSFPEQVCWWDDDIVVIKDKYPKAQHHWLIMPRREEIGRVTDLSKVHVPLLRQMMERGRITAQIAIGADACNIDSIDDLGSTSVIDKLNSDMSMCYRMGFHIVPSLRPLHLHVISQDFNSPALKTKRHYNTFTTPFFLPAHNVIEVLESKGHVEPTPAEQVKEWLGKPLTCQSCHNTFKNMPELCSHLQLHSH